jgi:hypothetical protein
MPRPARGLPASRLAVGDAGHVERAVFPDEPERRDVWEAVAVERGEMGGHIEREQRLDLAGIETSGRLTILAIVVSSCRLSVGVMCARLRPSAGSPSGIGRVVSAVLGAGAALMEEVAAAA